MGNALVAHASRFIFLNMFGKSMTDALNCRRLQAFIFSANFAMKSLLSASDKPAQPCSIKVATILNTKSVRSSFYITGSSIPKQWGIIWGIISIILAIISIKSPSPSQSIISVPPFKLVVRLLLSHLIVPSYCRKKQELCWIVEAISWRANGIWVRPSKRLQIPCHGIPGNLLIWQYHTQLHMRLRSP